MFNWRKRSIDLVGSVFFRGSIPPRPGDFGFLRDQGVRLEAKASSADGAGDEEET